MTNTKHTNTNTKHMKLQKIKQPWTAPAVRLILETAVEASRFTANITENHDGSLKIKMIRLRTRKGYCGNHPNECVINPFIGEQKHKVCRFLEGADWVEFNDMMNDALDRHAISCVIFSRPLEIKKKLMVRKGVMRRTAYNSEPFFRGGMLRGHTWIGDEPGVWADCTGQAPVVAEFPEGTPGIHATAGYNEH